MFAYSFGINFVFCLLLSYKCKTIVVSEMKKNILRTVWRREEDYIQNYILCQTFF